MLPLVFYLRQRLLVRFCSTRNTAPIPQHPRHVRFTVCPPTRYKEKRSLHDALENLASDPQLYTEEEMNDLRYEADRDHEDFVRLKGSPIVFGQRISLHQYHSELTMSFSTDPVRDGPGDDGGDVLTQTKVECSDLPEPGMVMRIMPGFQIRREGDPVRYGDVIVLKHGKYERRSLLVYPIAAGAQPDPTKFGTPYIVDRSRVVSSEGGASRLRVVPIATEEHSSMGNEPMHQKQLMGGAFVNLIHKESNAVLRGSSKLPTLENRYSGPVRSEDVAHSWCMQFVKMGWAGATLDGDKTFALKHSQTKKFLHCCEDGSVLMADEYDEASCHWHFELVDSDGSIQYDVDAFCKCRPACQTAPARPASHTPPALCLPVCLPAADCCHMPRSSSPI